MFSEKKNKNTTNTMNERNIIGVNTTFKGDVISEGDFRIDGKIEGTIKTSARIILGKQGVIEGDVICKNADVEGFINGSLKVEEMLSLKSSAKVHGEVVMGKLAVEPGAEFNVTCSMKSAVKELKHGKKTDKTA
jgi:cytoskeletal protein CcmA (bactofilin family)